jgi:hypothetical protein
MTIVKNVKNELIPKRTITGWWMCIDYRKLNKATKKRPFSATLYWWNVGVSSEPLFFSF